MESSNQYSQTKILLGFLSFLALIGFAIGFTISLYGSVWGSHGSSRWVAGYFGFGIPCLFLGLGASSLWEDAPQLKHLLGWTICLIALVCIIGLFFLVASWVGGSRSSGIYFFSFFIPVLVFGSWGISLIVEK